MASSSLSPDLPPAPDPTPPDPPTADTYPVYEIENLGGSTYIISVPKQGDLPFAYICNALILRNVVKLENKEVHQGTISKDILFEKFVTIVSSKWGLEPQDGAIRQGMADCFKSDTVLEPTFDGVDTFKGGRSHPHLTMSRAVGVQIYHGHVLDPENVKLKEAIKNNGCFQLLKTLKKKKTVVRRKGKVLDENWTIIDQFLSQHSPHSVSCLIERINSEVLDEKLAHAVSLFYWKKKFSTITIHGGTFYVLDAAASCLLNEIVWQRLTVITDLEDPYKDIFFDCHFRQIGQNKLEMLELHLHGNDDGESSSNTKTANADNKEFVEIIVQYGPEFLVKGLATQVTNSIERNTWLVAELNFPLFSPPMPTIIMDHLNIYSICGQTVPETEDCLKDVRYIKASVLSLVNAFLQKAEVSEQLEHDCIVPLMDTILQDYFKIAHEEVPSEFEFLSTTIVQKCKLIDQIFKFAFAPREVEMEAPKYLYLFSLLAKISTHHFELLAKLPVELVLMKFSQALMENKLSIVDNLDAIVEFLENFEKNIKCDNLVGLVLNEKMSIIFSTIVSVYSHANARKEPWMISEETLRSFKSAIFKLVEAFLEKAEGLKVLEDRFVIPLMHDALTGYMQDASDQMTSEFLSLSKIIIKKCSEIHRIFETLFNCSDKLTAYEEHHAYFFLLLGEACMHCSRVLTQLPLQQLNSVIEFARWVIKHNKLNISKAGVALLMDILKAFEVDKMSEPIWHEDEVPVHYNPIFVREKAAKFVQSKRKTILYSKASKFVDGVYAARNDSSGFSETSRKLLVQLKQPHESMIESSPVSISNETRALSSTYPSSELFDLTCEKHFKERLRVFLAEFEHLIRATVSAYVSDMKNELDRLFKESNPTLSTKSLGDDPIVSIDDMPQSMAMFTDFIRLLGNEIIKIQRIFSGRHSVDVENKTDIGLLALCSYLQEMCELHASGDSWDGQFTISDFKVFNNIVFRICRAPCGCSTYETEYNEFKQFAAEFLPLYGSSAFVQVLANDMMTHVAGKERIVLRLLNSLDSG